MRNASGWIIKLGKKKKQEKDDGLDIGEIDVDFEKIKDFFTNPKILLILLIIIPMFFAGYFRYYPANLPITKQWAESSLQNNLRGQFTSQINQQYPNLPDASKQQLVNEQVQNYLKQNEKSLEQAIEQGADNLKQQFKAEDGTTYLLAIDPWEYFRRTENIINSGYTWDVEEDGYVIDTHKYAPIGSKSLKSNAKFGGGGFHEWSGVFIHKIFSFFNKDISVMASFFWLPIIFSVLSVIPAFFLARKVSGNIGGFFAAFIIGIHPAFLGRTPGGFSDTDAYNVFFPLLISWLFIEAFEKKELKEKLIWGSLAGFAAGLYSFAWSGWWYIFDFILISMIGYIIYFIILYRDEVKKDINAIIKNKVIQNAVLLLSTFFTSSFVFVAFFSNLNVFKSAFTEPIARLAIKSAAKPDLWPNVFTTVAELNAASVSSIIGQIGGKLFFILALMGIMLTIKSKSKNYNWFLGGSALWFLLVIQYQSKIGVFTFLAFLGLPMAIGLLIPLIQKEENIEVKYAIYLTLWFLGTIFTATKGVRFVLLLVPVYGVAFGIAIGKIYSMIVDWFADEFEIGKTVAKVTVIAFLLILLINPIKAAHNTALREVPSMNDGWYQSLSKINNEAEPDAIINSWWDFGHWFKAIGDRAVTFDGGSQNTPMAYWIGKALLTGDEDAAIGILRMLDCGSNNAFDELNKVIGDTPKTVDILNEVILLDKIRAKAKLTQYSSKETADKVIELTHCTPPENYFITSQDMVGKAGVWAHFGSWDFRKSKMWIDYRNLMFDEFVEKAQNELGYDDKTAKDMFYQIQTLSEGRSANTWIAPWPSYMSGLASCRDNNDNTYVCGNGLIVNKTSFDAWVNTNNGVLHPKSFVYNESGKLKVKEYEKGKVLTTQDGRFIGAAMLKNGNTYYTILMDDDLAQSTFTKLFFLEGLGTTHFERFSDIRDVTGSRIIIWKVDWDGKQNED